MASNFDEDWKGKALVDVLNIIYLGHEDVAPEEQFGTITLCIGPDVQYIYKLDEGDNNPKTSIKYGDAIDVRFDGPICNYDDSFYMDFNLFRGAYKGIIDFSWKAEDQHDFSVQTYELTSCDGTGNIFVVIGRYANATVANVKVRLHNSAAMNVYGGIFASNSKIIPLDSANVLFLKKPDAGIRIGQDGVIPLCKSSLGVPLHSELRLDVSLKIDGVDYKGTVSFNQDNKVDVQFVGNISVQVAWERIILLGTNNDGHYRVEVPEELALEFHSLKDKIKRSSLIQPCYLLPGISRKTLEIVVQYCYTRIDLTTPLVDFVKLDGDTLINLIQAAHYFKIKSLMDSTCEALVAKVKDEDIKVILKVFNVSGKYTLKEKRLKRDEPASLGKLQDSKTLDSILRQRGKETFINKSCLVNARIPCSATEQLVLFKRWGSIFDDNAGYLEECHSKPDLVDNTKLGMTFESLCKFIFKDINFADRLSLDVVEFLHQFLEKTEKTDSLDDIDNKRLAARIFSWAISRDKFQGLWKPAVPFFVGLMSDPLVAVNLMGVDALACLAYSSPSSIEVILASDALERANELLNKPGLKEITKKYSDLRRSVANFLAAVCSGEFPLDKVQLALKISENLFRSTLVDDKYIAITCYTLQYLTYEKPVEIEEIVLKKFITTLTGLFMHFIDENEAAGSEFGKVQVVRRNIVASALGVVGNIARWGKSKQIQALAEDVLLLQSLEKILRSGIKKFLKEACQIISNIAAQNRRWIQVMHDVKLIKTLCSLLEGDMYASDVKLEAAWAMLNGIYGVNRREIDKYPEKVNVMEIDNNLMEI